MNRRQFIPLALLAPMQVYVEPGPSFEVTVRYFDRYWQVWWANEDRTVTITNARSMGDALDIARRYCESHFA